jgi:hypothetical protein
MLVASGCFVHHDEVAMQQRLLRAVDRMPLNVNAAVNLQRSAVLSGYSDCEAGTEVLRHEQVLGAQRAS